MKNKLILSLGTSVAVFAPVITAVSCNDAPSLSANQVAANAEIAKIKTSALGNLTIEGNVPTVAELTAAIKAVNTDPAFEASTAFKIVDATPTSATVVAVVNSTDSTIPRLVTYTSTPTTDQGKADRAIELMGVTSLGWLPFTTETPSIAEVSAAIKAKNTAIDSAITFEFEGSATATIAKVNAKSGATKSKVSKSVAYIKGTAENAIKGIAKSTHEFANGTTVDQAAILSAWNLVNGTPVGVTWTATVDTTAKTAVITATVGLTTATKNVTYTIAAVGQTDQQKATAAINGVTKTTHEFANGSTVNQAAILTAWNLVNGTPAGVAWTVENIVTTGTLGATIKATVGTASATKAITFTMAAAAGQTDQQKADAAISGITKTTHEFANGSTVDQAAIITAWNLVNGTPAGVTWTVENIVTTGTLGATIKATVGTASATKAITFTMTSASTVTASTELNRITPMLAGKTLSGTVTDAAAAKTALEALITNKLDNYTYVVTVDFANKSFTVVVTNTNTQTDTATSSSIAFSLLTSQTALNTYVDTTLNVTPIANSKTIEALDLLADKAAAPFNADAATALGVTAPLSMKPSDITLTYVLTKGALAVNPARQDYSLVITGTTTESFTKARAAITITSSDSPAAIITAATELARITPLLTGKVLTEAAINAETAKTELEAFITGQVAGYTYTITVNYEAKTFTVTITKTADTADTASTSTPIDFTVASAGQTL